MRDRAVELAALAGFSDPRPFSLRRLYLAARAKQRADWDRLAFLRLDLRKIFCKGADKLTPCDLNPTYTKKERRKMKKEARANAPKASARDVYEALTAK